MAFTIYKPVVLYSSITDQSISSEATLTLIDKSFKGTLDFISIRVQDQNMSVILEIDGNEIYELNLKNLKDKFKLNDTVYFDLNISKDGKHFSDKYSIPIPIDTNLKVKVKNNNSNTKKVNSYIIRVLDYRGN